MWPSHIQELLAPQLSVFRKSRLMRRRETFEDLMRNDAVQFLIVAIGATILLTNSEMVMNLPPLFAIF